MNHMLEIQITTETGATVGQSNPAESYAAKILEDAKAGFQKYRWDMIPNEKQPSAPTFLIIDDTEGMVSHLSMSPGGGELVKYVMTTTKVSDGSLIYNSVEMTGPDDDDAVLCPLYALRSNYLKEHDAAEANDTSDPVDSEDGSDIVDHFVEALLTDAKAYTPKLYYMRKDDTTFVCESFGISETRIVLQKQRETQYKVSLEYPDGSEVMGCTESCTLDTPSKVRELYQLIEQRNPKSDKDLAVKDAERFIDNMRYSAFLTRVLENAIPTVHTETEPIDKRWLVMDIIKAVPPRVVSRQLMEEISMRKGALNTEQSTKIRNLIEGAIMMVSNLERKPNGYTFTDRGVSVARDSEGRAANHIRFTSITRAANCYTTWPAIVFGPDVDMNSKTILVRCAVLHLAAMLAEQLMK